MNIRFCASIGIPTPVSSTVTNILIFSNSFIESLQLKFSKFSQLFFLSTTGSPLKVSHAKFDFDPFKILLSMSSFMSVSRVTSSARCTDTNMCPLSCVNCKRKVGNICERKNINQRVSCTNCNNDEKRC
ncbi:hypothetical protein HanIR_Chr12g0589961 [Helianthus annuus]|nr:hypothetical protein HanIR_Chr12g0589961 [Helianthus annuus]